MESRGCISNSTASIKTNKEIIKLLAFEVTPWLCDSFIHIQHREKEREREKRADSYFRQWRLRRFLVPIKILTYIYIYSLSTPTHISLLSSSLSIFSSEVYYLRLFVRLMWLCLHFVDFDLKSTVNFLLLMFMFQIYDSYIDRF